MIFRRMKDDKCYINASALTFWSVLSIVPMAAIAFGIAKGFGFENSLERQLYEKFPGQDEIVEQIVIYARALLENTQGGMIAGIGIIFLFWAGLKLLGHIERSFNDIWHVEKPRKLARKFAYHISLMIVGPVLMIISGSVTVFIQTEVTSITEKVALLGFISPVIFFFMKFLPIVLIWILLTMLYTMLPNTRVNFFPGVVAGIFAGTLLQLLQWTYIRLQIEVSGYNAVYGSFAVLPLFLVWLQTSWLVLLGGTELSRTLQNTPSDEYWNHHDELSGYSKKIVALRIAHFIIQRFKNSLPAPTVEHISNALKIPLDLTAKTVFKLNAAGILSKIVSDDDESPAFQPASDIRNLSIPDILISLDHLGVDCKKGAGETSPNPFAAILDRFEDLLKKESGNSILKDILVITDLGDFGGAGVPPANRK